VLECCYQNTGIAIAVAMNMFQNNDVSEAVKIPLLYGLGEIIILGIYLIVAWKIGWTKAPKNEKICTVITTSYELSCQTDTDDDDHDDPSLLQSSQDGNEVVLCTFLKDTSKTNNEENTQSENNQGQINMQRQHLEFDNENDCDITINTDEQSDRVLDVDLAQCADEEEIKNIHSD